MRFPTRPDTNLAVQSQKMAICLKFWIKEVEGLFYLFSKNKGANQVCSYHEADLHLFFAYAKSRFYHDAAQLKKS